VEKSSTKIRAISEFFTKLPKVTSDPIGEKSPNLGPIFRTFFSAKNHFPRKIPRNFLGKTNSAEFLGKTIFQNFFRGKLQFFPTFLGENFSVEFSAKFSPEKMYEKSSNLVTLWRTD
jgi:hypothetical protein